MSGATRRVLAHWDEQGALVYQAFEPRIGRAVGAAARGDSPLPEVPAESEYPPDAELARIAGYD